MRMHIPYSWRMSHDFACHSPACAPPPAGTGGSTPGGPNPQMAGRPHYTPSEHAGMYHTWDEKGQGGSMSGLEQAKRYVKGRETTLKRVKTQAAQRATTTPKKKEPSEREAQITRLVGTSAEKQRLLLSRGWRYDLFGNASPPKGTMTGAQARAAILKRLGHK